MHGSLGASRVWSPPRFPPPGLADIEPTPKPVLHDISIVIPTLGRTLLEHTLASILGGNAWPARIVVVHQGNEPRVQEFLDVVERAGIETRHLTFPPLGKSAAVNRGIEQIDTHLVAVTDDDCVVAPDWLTQMRDGLRAHPGAIVSGPVEPIGDEPAIPHVWSRMVAVQTRPSLVYDQWSGGNSGMSLQTYRTVGPFDEDGRLALAEDTEFAYRALRSGASVVYLPDVLVWHHTWRDDGQREGQLRGYARSHGAFYGKHIRRMDLFLALRAALHLGRATLRWVTGRVRGDREVAVYGRVYAIHLVPGIVAGLRKGREKVMK
jgi:GT2 family glycosyltransferase